MYIRGSIANTAHVKPYRKSFFNLPLVLYVSLGLGFAALFIVGILEQSFLATNMVALLLLVSGTLILLTESRNGKLPVELLRQFCVTFGLRIFVTFILHMWLVQVLPLPLWHWGGYVGGDEALFHEVSGKWARALYGGYFLTEEPTLQEFDYLAWTYLIGFTRFLGMMLNGDTMFNLKLLSCFFSALLVPYVYKLTQQFFSRDTARLAAVLSFLLPDYWYFGASLMRDPMISCMVVIVMYLLVSGIRDRFVLWRLVLAAILIFMVIPHLKVWLGEMLMVMACLWWSWNFFGKKFDRLFLIFSLAFLVVLILMVFPSIFYKAQNAFLYAGESIGLVQRLSNQRVFGIERASADSIGAQILGMPFYVYVPVNIVQLLLNIPPWGAINKFGFEPRAIIESITAVLWFGFVIFLPAGFLYCIRRQNRRYTIWIWGSALVMVVALSLASAISIRWRLMVMPFLLILIAQGISITSYRWITALSVTFIIVLLNVYIIVKYVF